MELINRYIEEVESYLPKRLQEDVARELRSNLEEGLEDRLTSGEWATKEEAEVSLLEELGPPHELAESYMPGPRVLFGPRLYPSFIRTMTIALSILAAIVALGLVVDFIRADSAMEFWMSIVGSIDNLFIGALLVLGAVVAIFAVIERTSDGASTKTEAWDPRSLDQPEDSDKVGRGEQIVCIVFLVLALVVLNLFPDKIGIFVHMDEHDGWVPMLSPAFWQQLWLLNACLGLDLVLQLLVLRRGEWSLGLRWIRVVVSLLFVVWLAKLVYGPDIFEIDVAWMVAHGWPESAVKHLGEIMHRSVLPVLGILLRVGFAAALVTLGIRIYDTAKKSLPPTLGDT